MNLSPHLFWDVDPESLDWEKHARFVIGRVLMKGTMEDWREIKRHYGLERIRAEVRQMRYLDAKTLSFCIVYFGIPREDFRCSTAKRQAPGSGD